MNEAVCGVFGNPSSTHGAGQIARQHLERARATVAKAIGGTPSEIVFTSGGTESNNLAIFGLIKHLRGPNPRVITTTVEHASVLECCRELERQGALVTYIAVDRYGVVDMQQLKSSIRPDTALISVMHANNETGTLQPLAEIAQIVHERRASGHQIFFHADGVQAVGKISVDVKSLGVDVYSMSAHKVFGPKGVGALFVRRGLPLHSVQFGGKHERERRAGTENVPGAIAFARALELCDEANDHTGELREFFESEVKLRLNDVEVNGCGAARLPNTSSVLFRGVPAESLVIALDMQGIAVSTGSACSSGSIEPSHVLLAMGRSRDEAKSSVRFSFGRYNTRIEVEQLLDVLSRCVNRLRGVHARETQLVN